ncbi:LysR family transcriptional regulator [Spongorhabdus nitratireducens]
MVNPVWLKTFKKLVEVGHFTRTAEQLAMTQPGVSQQVSKLEAHFGCALLQREGKSFELTPAGRAVYKFACTWLEEIKSLEQELKEDDPHKGELRLASPGALSLALYPQLVKLQVSHSKLLVNFEVAPNHKIVKDISENKIDMGWITNKPDFAELEFISYSKQALVLVVSHTTTISNWNELMKLGFINHPDGFHHASLLLSENMGKDFPGVDKLLVRGYINQLGHLLDPVAAGLGFTVVPETVVMNYPKNNQIKLVPLLQEVFEPVYLVYRKKQVLPARYAFIQSNLKI